MANPWENDPIVAPVAPVGATAPWSNDPLAADEVPAKPEEPGLLAAAGRGLGLGVRNVVQGVTSLGGPLYDLAALPQNALNAGVKAVTGKDLGIATTRSGGERLEQGLDAVGLPKPETARERAISHLVEGAAGVLPTMGAGGAINAARPLVGSMAERAGALLVGNPAGQVAAGLGSGAAGGAADEAGAGPLGQMGAGLVGALAGSAVPAAAGTAVRLSAGMAAPFTQAGREGIVANTLLRSSADPVGLEARLMASKLDPSLRLPDSPVTTAQAARDPGLSGIEGGLRSDTTPGAPGQLSPAARFANIDTARNAARAEALPAPAPEAVAGAGNQLRGQLQEAQGQRTAATSAAYEAIDPEGTSQIPIQHVQTTFNDAAAKYYGNLSGGLPGKLRDVSQDLLAAGPTVPWRDMQNLRGRLVALQDEFGGDARASAMLAQVKGAIDDVAQRAAHPMMEPSFSVTPEDIAGQHAAEGAAQRPDVVEALRQNRLPASAQSAASADGVPAPYEGLASFLISKGGIRNDGGEVMHLLGSTRARPALFSNTGLSLDRARELAHEAGYISGNADINGANGSTISDLMDALRSDLNNPRKPGRATALSGDRSLVEQVEQGLDQEHGLSLNDPPETVLRAVRDPTAGETPSGPAPDGYAPIPDAFTPEQAARWREATARRTQDGQDFGLDQTGARAVPNILQRGEGGGPNVPDQSVMAHALGSPNAVRQVLRAVGPDALPGLRQSFMDRAFEATASKTAEAPDGNPLMGAPGFLKYWSNNQETARLVFPPKQLENLTRLANDFSETASAQAMRRVGGSDTARNLSVANVIAMASKGMIDPGNTAVQALMSPVTAVAKLSGGEAAVKHLLVEAMADPVLAQRLLAKATPDALNQAASYVGSSMAQRFGTAVQDASGRTALRVGQAGAMPPEQQQQQAQPPMRVAPPPRALPPPAVVMPPDQRRRAEMAQRLMAG